LTVVGKSFCNAIICQLTFSVLFDFCNRLNTGKSRLAGKLSGRLTIHIRPKVDSYFKSSFDNFCRINRSRRQQEIKGNSAADLRGWYEALDSLLSCYQFKGDRQLLAEALSDPYFPFTKLQKLNVHEFGSEPGLNDLSAENLARIAAEHLLHWVKIFLSIRLALRGLNKDGQVSTMSLKGSPEETIPQTDACNHCGCCCEIRGGPAEFTGSVEPPREWLLYFRGDGSGYQRFCPFLFEYFAMGKFFCSIYLIKPQCCWEFDREECDFLQKDVARERNRSVGGEPASSIK
jgi:hypothetical protein